MGLFSKKFCDVCGDKIGLLGNRKLEDGNLCKDCAKQLSPFFDDRRNSTVEEIKAQLEYRENNKKLVEEFNPTKTIGNTAKIHIDEDKGQWLFTRSSKWREANPDIIKFSQVTGCNLDIDENKREIYRETKDGKRESYSPPKYKYDYDFFMIIHINSPWFDDIKFKINDNDIDSKVSPEYREAQKNGKEIIDELTWLREKSREANVPKLAISCPNCHATTIPNENGCCEYCGGAVN